MIYPGGSVAHMKKINVRIGRAKIRTEVADTKPTKSKGLMFRQSLGKGEGMLFIFDEETRHPFWMFGMRFPIDIIWVDSNKRVVDVTEDARPCWLFCKVHRPKRKARYVIEVNSGFAKRNKIKKGDKVSL
jgi:uncharacterized membrane protein (UPF0127 family)